MHRTLRTTPTSAGRLARLLPAVLLPLSVSGRPAHSQPRVLMHVENATLPEVVRALERETGVHLALQHDFPANAANPGGEPGMRATFTWENVPLGRAVRDICQTYGYSARLFGAALDLEPDAAMREKPRSSPYQAQANGFTFTATRVERTVFLQTTIVHALGDPDPKATRTASDNSSLTLEIAAPDSDPDGIARVENLRIVSDKGPVECCQGLMPGGITRSQFASLGSNPLDDRWVLRLDLQKVPAGARALAEVSGEVVAYRGVKWEHTTVPLPPPNLPFATKAGVATLTVKKAETKGQMVSVECELRWPKGLTVVGPYGYWLKPALTLRSGKLAQLNYSSSGSEAGDDQVQTYQFNGTFAPADPPAAVELGFSVCSDPSVRIPLKLENIPFRVGEDGG